MKDESSALEADCSKTKSQRRAERAAKRSLFAAEVERLKDMPNHCPWSHASLLRYAAAGILKTRKVAGTRVVLRQDWYDFIAGQFDDRADLEEASV